MVWFGFFSLEECLNFLDGWFKEIKQAGLMLPLMFDVAYLKKGFEVIVEYDHHQLVLKVCFRFCVRVSLSKTECVCETYLFCNTSHRC